MRKFYLCKKCGNVVSLLVNGKGTLICCGEPMEELTANTVDAALEKHVPTCEVRDNKIVIKVGEVLHPMDEEHYINFVALQYDDTIEIHNSKPRDQPIWVFHYVEHLKVYAYCNKHGLWETHVN